jgi:hypothetical protein
VRRNNRGTRRLAAVLGVVACVFTASSITAEAQPAALQWTVTPTGRQPANLDDIDSRAGETWAVGGDQIDGFQDQRPLALRWDGRSWKATAQPVRTNATLQSVAVAGARNVWAVGEDRADPETPKPLVMHWNGTRWRVVPGPSVPTGSFGTVAIGPNGAVWAAGWANVDGKEHAVVYRYSGGTWQPLTTGLEGSINGNTLAVISAKDAWLGLNGGLAHFDGKRWTLVDDVPADGSQIPTGIAVAGPKDIWLVGVEHVAQDRPLVLHYDGVSWTRVPAPTGWSQLYDVALRGNRPVAVGERFEESGNFIFAKPYVLEYRGSKFVEAPSPDAEYGTLTGAAAANGRLWTTGLTSTTPDAPFSAFTAFAR